MQAFGSPYVCPYFTCTSPYCLTARNNVVAASGVLNPNRSSTSPTQNPVSSFSISSILSRAEDQEKAREIQPATKAETTMSFAPYHTTHISMDRFHPYHRVLGRSAFARAASCQQVAQKGKA